MAELEKNEEVVEKEINTEPKYHLVTPDDPILREKIPDFDFKNPPVDPEVLAGELAEHMMGYGGIGLSANQLGLPYRVFAMRAEPSYVCYNPRITAFSDQREEILLDEGCLTFPLLFLKIKRPRFIRVRFQMPSGKWKTMRLDGMAARVYQHELDHLNGVLMTDHVSQLKLNRAKDKQMKLFKKISRENKRRAKKN